MHAYADERERERALCEQAHTSTNQAKRARARERVESIIASLVYQLRKYIIIFIIIKIG